ncbi:MAG: 2-amino-4-hydroxy-6-hydroxymethyldihydropteridine diphosphokinase, partial [Ilyomonas sp.]
MNKAYLLIGGNLGDRLHNLAKASQLIEQYAGTIIQGSAVYETEAWGLKDQPSFYNQALELQTPLAVKTLMQTLLQIEEQMGRKRVEKNGPRNIDIDILLFNDSIVHNDVVTVPHPRLTERKFAL